MPKKSAYVDERLLTRKLTGQTGTRYHLTVERLPRAGWDWVVWPIHEDLQLIRTGVTRTKEHAQLSAESAMNKLEISGECSNLPQPQPPSSITTDWIDR